MPSFFKVTVFDKALIVYAKSPTRAKASVVERILTMAKATDVDLLEYSTRHGVIFDDTGELDATLAKARANAAMLTEPTLGTGEGTPVMDTPVMDVPTTPEQLPPFDVNDTPGSDILS